MSERLLTEQRNPASENLDLLSTADLLGVMNAADAEIAAAVATQNERIAALVDAIASFSFLSRFEAIGRGVIEARDLVFFVSLMAVWLFATVIAVDSKKTG